MFYSFLDHHLALLEHVHELDADQRALGRLKRFEPQHGTRHPLDGAMVLPHPIVEILILADGDRRAVLLVVSPDGGRYSPSTKSSRTQSI